MKVWIKKLLKKLSLNGKKEFIFFTKDHYSSKKYIIGEFTYGKPKVLFDDDHVNLYIGKYCSISQNVTIFLGGNHRLDWVTTYPFNALTKIFPEAQDIKGHPATKGNVVIGNDVWIGRDVIILSGIKIGNGAVIGAGSVVSKDIGDYEVWAGNPAKFIKKRFDDDVIDGLLKLKWWNWPDDKVKVNLKLLCSANIEDLLNENLYS